MRRRLGGRARGARGGARRGCAGAHARVQPGVLHHRPLRLCSRLLFFRAQLLVATEALPEQIRGVRRVRPLVPRHGRRNKVRLILRARVRQDGAALPPHQVARALQHAPARVAKARVDAQHHDRAVEHGVLHIARVRRRPRAPGHHLALLLLAARRLAARVGGGPTLAAQAAAALRRPPAGGVQARVPLLAHLLQLLVVQAAYPVLVFDPDPGDRGEAQRVGGRELRGADQAHVRLEREDLRRAWGGALSTSRGAARRVSGRGSPAPAGRAWAAAATCGSGC